MINRTTVHLMMQTSAIAVSLGLWGYILVMLNIISEETFNESVDKLNAVKATILAGVEKAKGNKVA